MRPAKLLPSFVPTVVVFGMAACGTGAPDLSPQQTDPALLAGNPAPEVFPGYKHTRERSRFLLGTSSPTIQIEGGFEKSIGAQGVFATDAVNGWALAVPNADAPIKKRPPFPGNADDHNRHTLEYFLASGIPKDQVTGVHVNTLMRGGMNANGEQLPNQFLGYYSCLERSIQGVPVVESQAWARFNVDGDVVEESVYWPALPPTLEADITNFQVAALDNAYRAKLAAPVPLDFASGKIAIHHSSSTDHRKFTVVITYDVNPAEHRKGRTHHFDINGRAVIISNETENLSVPTKPRRSLN